MPYSRVKQHLFLEYGTDSVRNVVNYQSTLRSVPEERAHLNCGGSINFEYFFSSGLPRNFVREGSTNSVEDRGPVERRPGGGSPPVRGSGGSCNLIQEISFHIVKFS